MEPSFSSDNLQIRHIKREDNVIADALSRPSFSWNWTPCTHSHIVYS